MKLWVRIWLLDKKWIHSETDLDHVAILCECMDERVALRVKVLRGGEWRDRVALRNLDDQMVKMMGALGLNPTDRVSLDTGIEEPANVSPLGRIRHSLGVVG
jgi:hypothetical protein